MLSYDEVSMIEITCDFRLSINSARNVAPDKGFRQVEKLVTVFAVRNVLKPFFPVSFAQFLISITSNDFLNALII